MQGTRVHSAWLRTKIPHVSGQLSLCANESPRLLRRKDLCIAQLRPDTATHFKRLIIFDMIKDGETSGKNILAVYNRYNTQIWTLQGLR